MNTFKDAFKDCGRKFTQPESRGHNFITQNLFNECLLVAGSLLNRVGCVVTRVTWVCGLRGSVGAWVEWVKFLRGLHGLRGSKYFLCGLRG